MSPDVFEDELRTLLHDATEAESPAFRDVDTHAVVGTGHRVVRRRRLAMAGGTLAATLVVAVGTWAAVGGSVDRALEEVPATPSRPVTAVLDEFSNLSGPDGALVEIPGPRRVAVTVDPVGTPDLVVTEVGTDGTRTAIGSATLRGVPPSGAAWTVAGAGAHVLVGVLPAEAAAFQLVTPLGGDGGHASTTVRADLPGTGRQAFAVRFAEAPDAGAVRHLLWWDGAGTVRDEAGAVVPSVALGDPAGTTVFVAESLDRVGTFSGDGASSARLDGEDPSAGPPDLSMAQQVGDSRVGLHVDLVPAGSTAGTFTPASGTTVTQPLTVVTVPGTDLAVLWAGYESPAERRGSPYETVTWTEPDGRVVTQRP